MIWLNGSWSFELRATPRQVLITFLFIASATGTGLTIADEQVKRQEMLGLHEKWVHRSWMLQSFSVADSIGHPGPGPDRSCPLLAANNPEQDEIRIISAGAR